MHMRKVVICLILLGGATFASAGEGKRSGKIISRMEVDSLVGEYHSYSCIYWLRNDALYNEVVFVVKSASAPYTGILKAGGKLIELGNVAGDSGCDRKKEIHQKFSNASREASLTAKLWGGNKLGGDVYQGTLKVTSKESTDEFSVEGECMCFSRDFLK